MGIGCSCCTWCKLLCADDKKSGARAYHPMLGSNDGLLPTLKEGEAPPEAAFNSRATVSRELRSVGSLIASIKESLTLEGLDQQQRTEAAAYWAKSGREEHAAVASFGLYAQQLLAVGAPMEMVREAFVAAEEETGHSALCFALAEAFANARCPVPTYVPHALQVSPSLEALIVETVQHGSVEETLGALAAARKAHLQTLDSLQAKKEYDGLSEDPVVMAVWERVAIDEAHHAAFGWRVIQWALRADPTRVLPIFRQAYQDVFAEKRRQGWPAQDLAIVQSIAEMLIFDHPTITLPSSLPSTSTYQTTLQLIVDSL